MKRKVKLFFVKLFRQTGFFYNKFYSKGKLARGIIKYKDKYYYINKNNEITVNSEIKVEEMYTNGLMRHGTYWTNGFGEITNPNDPAYPGLPTKAQLDEIRKKGIEVLKSGYRKNNHNSKKKNKTKHIKLESARFVYTDYDNYYLNQLWVRKEDQSKICYDSKSLSYDKRNIVNHIRHKCSNYDSLLSSAGAELDKENYHEFHHILKKECLYLIGKVYNNLESTCKEMIKEIN